MRSAKSVEKAALVVLLLASQGAGAADLSFLQSLLDATPAGGWVKASTNTFSAAWPTGQDRPPPTPSGPESVAYAWSGFAWDSQRANLLLFGGGHANYVGNEVYVWNGTNGQWTLGALPSKVDISSGNGYVIGNDAPQSSHTYQTNIYVPVNDRFVVFGGASWNSGGTLANANGRTGAWWWNPALADPSRVGGGDGTGWNASRLGSNAWQVRPYDPWVGLPASGGGPNYIYGTTATRVEGGKDVIYLTMDQSGSGFPRLYRYELGTPSTPDTWQQVGVAGVNFLSSGAATIDTQRGLFVRTALANGPFYQSDLAVWNLANNNPANPSANPATGIQLVESNGTPWATSFAASIDYDAANDQYVIWDSRNQGTVWITRPEYLSNGALDPVWTIVRADSTTAAQPVGNHGDGVLGKWEYVEELGAFVAMDSYSFGTQDAAIWLYKPLAAAVPEAPVWQALLMGGALLGWSVRRRRRR